MSKIRLDGIFVPHVTPFTREGELDCKGLRRCVGFWVDGGVSGLVPCGSNGEAPYLSRHERMKVIETVLDEANGKVSVVAGTGSISTRETITFTKDARDLGVDAVLVVTPFYFRLSNREIYEHYSAVLRAVDVPLVLYNVPKFTGFSIEPTVVSQLASDYDSVIGIKDSSGNISTITELLRLVGDRISVLAGAADLTLSTLMMGGRGAIIAVANAFPELCSHLYDAYARREYEEASKLQLSMSYINEVLVKRYNQLSAIKEALRLRNLPAGYPRRPALPLKEEERTAIENMLNTISEQF